MGPHHHHHDGVIARVRSILRPHSHDAADSIDPALGAAARGSCARWRPPATWTTCGSAGSATASGPRPTWCVDGRLTLAEAQLIAHEAQHRRADGGPLARHDAVTPTVEQ